MNSDKLLISIIVPIYKVEDLIERCVNSLVNQTYENIEIILVDDGSPDNCPQICDEYSKTDHRIKVIHKKNGGLSDARNAGLEAAKGEYVMFVDSDDYIEIDSCEKFSKEIDNERADILVSGAKKITGSKISLMKPSEETINKKYNGKEYLKIELKNQNAKMAVWLNLYRREFLLDNNLTFKVGLLHEDEQWTPRVFLLSESVKILGYPFYNYIIREDSISKAKDFSRNAQHIVSIVMELQETYSKLKDIELMKLLNDYLVTIYLVAVKKGNLATISPEMIYREFSLKNSYSFKNRAKSLLFFLSPKLYCRL